MTTRTTRWGTLLLILSALAAAAMGTAAAGTGPLPPLLVIRTVLPAIALVLSIAVLFAGHVSYPRVQNLRVYLAGYSVGLQGIVYALVRGFDSFFVDAAPRAPAGYAELMLALGIVGAYVYSLVPQFPTFRSTRLITWILVGVQAILLIVARFAPASFSWLAILVPDRLVSMQTAAVASLTVAVIVINATLSAESYFLRGTFSGLALLAGATWLMPSLLAEMGYAASPLFLHILYAATAPLFLSISILFHILARMDHRVAYDPLLQIYNRDYVDRVLTERSNLPTRPPFAVMMIDIDHFKDVNDTHGHQAGDRVLFTVAQTVQKLVVPEGVVCRYGGEELVVFFPGLSGRDIVPLAKRLCTALETTETVWRRQRIGVTVSIGLSDRKFPRQSVAQVVQAADKALYIAKENGRNQVRFVRIRDPRRVSR